MIFKLVKVDPTEGRIAFECNSALSSIESYFAFLNMWSVIKDERAEASHSLYYDSDTAIQQEDILSVETSKITVVIKKLH
jgi:hypothetical protein